MFQPRSHHQECLLVTVYRIALVPTLHPMHWANVSAKTTCLRNSQSFILMSRWILHRALYSFHLHLSARVTYLLQLDDPGFDPIWGQEIFSSPNLSRFALGPTQPVHWGPFPAGKAVRAWRWLHTPFLQWDWMGGAIPLPPSTGTQYGDLYLYYLCLSTVTSCMSLCQMFCLHNLMGRRWIRKETA